MMSDPFRPWEPALALLLVAGLLLAARGPLIVPDTGGNSGGGTGVVTALSPGAPTSKWNKTFYTPHYFSMSRATALPAATSRTTTTFCITPPRALTAASRSPMAPAAPMRSTTVTTQTERRTISFILRLWAEPAAIGEQPRWQGQLEHVGSGQVTHFQIPPALVQFLIGCLPPRAAEQGRAGESPGARLPR